MKEEHAAPLTTKVGELFTKQKQANPESTSRAIRQLNSLRDKGLLKKTRAQTSH